MNASSTAKLVKPVNHATDVSIQCKKKMGACPTFIIRQRQCRGNGDALASDNAYSDVPIDTSAGQAPHPSIVQPIQPHSASGSAADIDELDGQTEALIKKLALDDLADDLGPCKGKGRAGSLPLDEDIVHQLQSAPRQRSISTSCGGNRRKS